MGHHRGEEEDGRLYSSAPPSPSPRRCRQEHYAAEDHPPGQNLSSPTTTDGKHHLGLGKKLPILYTPARRFPGPTPSPTPLRPPEKEEAGGIAAGKTFRLLFASSNCSRRKRMEGPRSLRSTDEYCQQMPMPSQFHSPEMAGNEVTVKLHSPSFRRRPNK